METSQSEALHDAVGHLEVGELGAVPEGFADRVCDGCLLDVLDMVPTHAGPGACRATMRVGPQHLNQRGLVQGGALVALADAAAGWATYPAVPVDARFTTLELKANLLGAAREGDDLVALARPVHVGRSTIVLDVEVLRADQEGLPPGRRRLVARFSCTQMVLR